MLNLPRTLFWPQPGPKFPAVQPATYPGTQLRIDEEGAIQISCLEEGSRGWLLWGHGRFRGCLGAGYGATPKTASYENHKKNPKCEEFQKILLGALGPSPTSPLEKKNMFF